MTPGQRERYDIFIEEMGEVIQGISKCSRFTFNGKHPDRTTTNQEDLENEIGNLLNALHLLIAAGDLNRDRIELAARLKRYSIHQYMNYPHEVAAYLTEETPVTPFI